MEGFKKVNQLERKQEDFKRNDGELLINDLYYSQEFLSLVKKIKSGSSFDEINQLIESFNNSEDVKVIGVNFKDDKKAGRSEVDPIYVEKNDEKSIQKIEACVSFGDGKVFLRNGMNKDGTIADSFR